MKIYDLISINPKSIKVHLAMWNGHDDPIDLFFDGSFQKWQEHQNKRNFGRQFILSLIKYQSDGLWLFAGIYESKGITKSENNYHFYKTELSNYGKDLIGRLIIKHTRKSRNSYPYGESIIENSEIYEIKPEPLAFSDFTSFKDVSLNRSQLEMLYRLQYPSWKAALSSVSAIYLISDHSNGKLYVGSAYGEDGLWGRWASYAASYHGGNKDLRTVFKSCGPQGFESFQYSILETCDLDMPPDSVISIESRWKDRLLSRVYGYNSN